MDTQRLRLARDADYETGNYLCGQAADEIERLRAALKHLRDAYPYKHVKETVAEALNEQSGVTDDRT